MAGIDLGHSIAKKRLLQGASLVVFLGAACSSKPSGGPSTPDPTPPPGSTVTITSSGVNPKSVQVAQGTRVLFVNSSAFSPVISSDPHPEHTDCPEINNVGFISPGQSKETGNLNTVRTCGYHDHDHPDDARFKGTIVIR
jgi:hypothetical protein